MNTDTNFRNAEPLAYELKFTPLADVTNPTVPTDAAAFYLNRRPQTLRAWSSNQHSIISPVRINGRLAWNVAEIRALLNGGA